MTHKIMAILASYLVAIWVSAPGDAATRHSLDIGILEIGQPLIRLPKQVVRVKDCENKAQPLTCRFLLPDGIWYRLDKGGVADKTYELPAKSLPTWAVPSDNPLVAIERARRLTGLRFERWHDDYDGEFVESTEPMKSRYGKYFWISIYFKKGRMKDVSITSLPHPDV